MRFLYCLYITLSLLGIILADKTKDTGWDKTKIIQLTISVWHNEQYYNKDDWKQMYQMLEEYENIKNAGDWSIQLLDNTLLLMYAISESSNGTIWQDGSVLFIPDSSCM